MIRFDQVTKSFDHEGTSFKAVNQVDLEVQKVKSLA